MSVDRTSVRSARATKRLNRTLLVGALLGLTLSAGVAPSSMAWGEDTDGPSGTASATSDSRSAFVQDATSEASETTTPATTESSTPESSGTPQSSSSTREPSEASEAPSAGARDESSEPEEIAGTQGSSAAEESQIKTMGIEPFIVGVPDGVNAPYVYWTVKDSTGDPVPVGGATFRIQGPRDNASTGNDSQDNRWNSNSHTVEDCQTAPSACPANSRDRDPDPGEFLVKYMNNSNNGTEIASNRRYRVQQVQAPEGYTWTTPGDWKVIPGNGQTPASGAWGGEPNLRFR